MAKVTQHSRAQGTPIGGSDCRARSPVITRPTPAAVASATPNSRSRPGPAQPTRSRKSRLLIAIPTALVAKIVAYRVCEIS
jgi:hypothetical protein